MIMNVWKDPPSLVTHKLACYQIEWFCINYCPPSSFLSLSHCFTCGSTLRGDRDDLFHPSIKACQY